MAEDDSPAGPREDDVPDEAIPTRPDQDAAEADPTVEADMADPGRPGPGDSDGARPDLFDPETQQEARGAS